MRLLDERPERLATIPYRAAGPGGATQNVQLAVERLRVDALPDGCAAVVAVGDLQGVAPSPLGRESIRGLLERRAPALTLCGHVHWDEPVAPLGDGHVVNVDARVVVFTA